MKKFIYSILFTLLMPAISLATQASIGGPIAMPEHLGLSGTPSFSDATAITASGHKYAFILQAPKSGTLDKLEFRLGTVTQAPANGLRVSFQDVTASTGAPDGVQDQYCDVTSGLTANTCIVPGNIMSGGCNTGAKRNINKGDIIAIVIEYVSFATNDSLSISTLSGTAFQDATNIPYLSVYTASWANNSAIPVFALKYDDGTYASIDNAVPYSSFTTITYNSGSTPNEYGVLVTPQVPLTTCGIWVTKSYNATNHNYTVKLYSGATSPGGSTLASVTRNSGTGRSTTSAKTDNLYFSSNVTLSAGSPYRITLVPGDTNNVSLYQGVLNSAALQDSMVFGQNAYMTQANGSSWTDTTSSRILMGLLVCGFDDGQNITNTYSSATSNSLSMLNLKYNSSQWIPFKIKDSAGYPVLSVSVAGLTAYYRKGLPGAWTSLTIQAGDGSSTGQDCATDGTETPESGDVCASAQVSGDYRVYVPATVVNLKGKFALSITGSGYESVYQEGIVQAYTDEEESDKMPSSGTISNLTPSDNVGINWGNVSNPTSTVGLTGTTVGIKAGGITPLSYSTAGTIVTANTTTLTTTSGVIATTGQYDNGYIVQVYEASTGNPEASSCIATSTNGGGSNNDTLITTDDLSGYITASDLVDIIPDKGCASRLALPATRTGSPVCDITAAISGSSFTVLCTNSEGGAITLAADKWVGTIWRAYTNGGAACNVIDEKIRISAITSGGVITAQNDTQFKPFTLTPNISNCGIFNP